MRAITLTILTLALASNCMASEHPTFTKEHIHYIRDLNTTELLTKTNMLCPEMHVCRDEGAAIFWKGPTANNIPHVCAAVFQDMNGKDGPSASGQWSGEFHRDGEETAYIVIFLTEKDAEKWGDSVCPATGAQDN